VGSARLYSFWKGFRHRGEMVTLLKSLLDRDIAVSFKAKDRGQLVNYLYVVSPSPTRQVMFLLDDSYVEFRYTSSYNH
jgi:hypothetical protein